MSKYGTFPNHSANRFFKSTRGTLHLLVNKPGGKGRNVEVSCWFSAVFSRCHEYKGTQILIFSLTNVGKRCDYNYACFILYIVSELKAEFNLLDDFWICNRLARVSDFVNSNSKVFPIYIRFL